MGVANLMRSNYLIYAFAFSLLWSSGTVGCSKKESFAVQPSTKNAYVKSDLTASFGDKLKLSRQLVSYLEEAKKMVSAGRYEDALIEYGKADTLSSDRATKTMINEGYAETYLLMNNFQKAALYFEKAADSTMNTERVEEFNRKANELRQKK